MKKSQKETCYVLYSPKLKKFYAADDCFDIGGRWLATLTHEDVVFWRGLETAQKVRKRMKEWFTHGIKECAFACDRKRCKKRLDQLKGARFKKVTITRTIEVE